MQPTTIASRRAVWGGDARQLVADLVRAGSGGGGETWRIAYLAGARAEPVKGAVDLITARVRPHLQHRVRIRLDGTPPGQGDIDALCWHMDQDARTGDREPDERETLPAGALLVDPLFAAALAAAGMDEQSLRNEIEAREDGVGARGRRIQPLRLRGGSPVAWADLEFHMNEVRASFDLPGGRRARWKAGYLEIETGPDPIPETVMLGARGRTLRDTIDHPLIRAATEIRVTGVSQVGGAMALTTDARAPSRLTTIPPRARALAA